MTWFQCKVCKRVVCQEKRERKLGGTFRMTAYNHFSTFFLLLPGKSYIIHGRMKEQLFKVRLQGLKVGFRIYCIALIHHQHKPQTCREPLPAVSLLSSSEEVTGSITGDFRLVSIYNVDPPAKIPSNYVLTWHSFCTTSDCDTSIQVKIVDLY